MRSRIEVAIHLAASFIFLITTSCNSQSESNTNPTSENFVLVKSSLARDMDPEVSGPDLTDAAAGNTEFALKAFPLLESNPGKNTVFSPYSITLALALTAAGAKGTTLSGIETAMSFSLPQDRLHPAFNKLDLLLASKATGTVHQNGTQSPRLNIVNAIWGQNGFPLLPSYLDTIALNYGAGLHLVDFVNKTEDARLAINSWVEKQTKSKIKDLMKQGSVANDTRVVLTNAIWFKATWATTFPVESTNQQAFTNRDGSGSTVPFMNKTFPLPYTKGSGCQAVDMPYVDGNLSMLVIMPDAGTFDAFLSSLTPSTVNDIVGALTNREIALELPKFTFSTELDMQSVLTNLGMPDAFDAKRADFSGIDGRRDLFVQSVVHQAFISVDEYGTEAAAATAVGFGITGIPAEPAAFIVDHPFLFMIRDRETGLILFMGKVVGL